jgi:general secretion pathway protein E/type IV pilus assembly protein PilB
MTTSNRRAQATEPYSDNDAVQVLNELVGRALQSNASDLHLEPKRDVLQVRFRIDGRMVEQHGIEYSVAPQVIQRIKVLARMDIAERRVPQDGQFSLNFGQPVHLRASTFPCSQGEKVVLRLLRGPVSYTHLRAHET